MLATYAPCSRCTVAPGEPGVLLVTCPTHGILGAYVAMAVDQALALASSHMTTILNKEQVHCYDYSI